MGDGLKLSKDKRHKSSSSLAGVVLEGTRSERKIDVRASIPEVEDQFALAEARCDDLQEKINIVKGLKRKKKLKKRSVTRISEEAPIENIPFISVRAMPKKKVSQQAARLRRLEVPPNPTRGYLDPATVEQHRMIGQVRGYNQIFKQPLNIENKDLRVPPRLRGRRAQAEGDSMLSQGERMSTKEASLEVACGDDVVINFSENETQFQQSENVRINKSKKSDHTRQTTKPLPATRRRNSNRDYTYKEDAKWTNKIIDESAPVQNNPALRRRQYNIRPNSVGNALLPEDRPVVELFSKNRTSVAPSVRQQSLQDTDSFADKKAKKNTTLRYDIPRPEAQCVNTSGDTTPGESKKEKEVHRHPRRVKYRSRRYELPTVASQMKQAGMRYYYGNSNHTNIPFIVSKSTAPSHNIGVNIQQVLNGLKIQQPLSGIPLTIAHHMGLGHIPNCATAKTPVQPALDNREINVIKLGRKLLRLPSYKYVSYNRLLSMYREGDGMVPRFLRAISRPHYFYSSMYNLISNREDFETATSKGRIVSKEAKQSLAEYASLYREYEQIEKCINDGKHDHELERRKEELSRELAAREEHIRKVMQEYRTVTDMDQSNLRASASTAEDGYRHSTFKLNLGDAQQ